MYEGLAFPKPSNTKKQKKSGYSKTPKKSQKKNAIEYSVLPLSKPSNTSKKALNNKRQTERKPCSHCKKWDYLQTNEIFRGINRQISIENGFQNELCPECHRNVTLFVDDEWIAIDLKWKQEAQRKYEETHSRAEFVTLIGENFLDVIPEV